MLFKGGVVSPDISAEDVEAILGGRDDDEEEGDEDVLRDESSNDSDVLYDGMLMEDLENQLTPSCNCKWMCDEDAI